MKLKSILLSAVLVLLLATPALAKDLYVCWEDGTVSYIANIKTMKLDDSNRNMLKVTITNSNSEPIFINTLKVRYYTKERSAMRPMR